MQHLNLQNVSVSLDRSVLLCSPWQPNIVYSDGWQKVKLSYLNLEINLLPGSLKN